MAIENGTCLMPLETTMLGCVKAFAVRHFPPGCGRHVPQINAEQTSNGDALRSIENGVDASEKHDRGKAPIEASGSLVPTEKLEHENGLESKLENETIVPNVLGGPSLVEEQMGVKLLGSLDDGRIDEPEKELENSNSESFLKTNHEDVASQKQIITQNLGLSIDIPLCGALEMSKTRNYPPRRKVSAVRKFPPLCGRSARLTMKIDSQYGSASPNDNVFKEKPVQDVKRVEESSECQDADEVLRAVLSDLQATSEEDTVKKDEVGKYIETKMTQEDQADNLGRSPQGSRFVYQSKAVVSESDAAVLAERAHEEIVGKGRKRKIGEISKREGIMQKDDNKMPKLLPKRVVVLGLRAATFSEMAKKGHHSVNSQKLKSASKKMKVEQKIQGKKVSEKALPPTEDAGEEGMPQPVILGNEDSIDLDGQPREGAPYSPSDNISLGSGKKNLYSASSEKTKPYFRNRKGKQKVLGEKLPEESSPAKIDADDEGTCQLVVWKGDDPVNLDGQCQDPQVANKPKNYCVNVPPLRFGYHLTGDDEDHGTSVRNKVRETLRLFQAVCRKLLQEEEAKSKDEVKHRRVDLQAAKILKDKDRYINTGKQILGSVPGVEVGDEFQYRVELNVIGLHRQIQGGIDYVRQGRMILATSIVSSGAYADDLENSDFLIYTGQGGNVIGKDKEPEDQKLERGNLALKNSISAKNPVRVIRGLKEMRPSESSDSRSRVSVTYIYDGLYVVNKFWREQGPHGKMVFKFHLNRIPGQPELAWKQVKRSRNFETREGLCVKDISEGKEVIPIGAVNTIDDEKPLPFTYITRMIYPDWCNPIPRVGCNCSRGCLDSQECACTVLNGGEIPYNYNGAIVEAKPLVYECGSSCKCPPSCPNRVSQHGIKFQLEIFKTDTRGWAVRSLDSIPSGSFICEYMGELLEDKEAEERTNDEYLFDIGNNYNDSNLWEGLSTLIPDMQSNSCDHVENVGFTIDAAKYGNVGRFINHSCSPNLYAQNVLYDHDDKRIPHIMLFAAENIPPLQELTYDYNYKIDQVRNSDGSVRRKSCFCGAPDCTGRMY